MSVQRGALRTIATFEAVKGITALAAGAGLVGLMHRDLHRLAATLIGHIGLEPGGRYPSLLLHYADLLSDGKLQQLIAIAALYATVRLAEAWGLWHLRTWGEWLGALSGAVYLPLEWRHVLHRPGVANVAVFATNIGVVAFLAWRLWRVRIGAGRSSDAAAP